MIGICPNVGHRCGGALSDMVLTCWPSCKKWSRPRFPWPRRWAESGQFFLKAFCKIAIFRPFAARSLQRPPGRAWRNKVLADSADDPDDADKPDDLDESDNSDDSDDSLMTSWASCPSCKKWSWPRFPRPGQWPKSGQFLLTAYCKMTIFSAPGGQEPSEASWPGLKK